MHKANRGHLNGCQAAQLSAHFQKTRKVTKPTTCVAVRRLYIASIPVSPSYVLPFPLSIEYRNAYISGQISLSQPKRSDLSSQLSSHLLARLQNRLQVLAGLRMCRLKVVQFLLQARNVVLQCGILGGQALVDSLHRDTNEPVVEPVSNLPLETKDMAEQ